MKWSEITFNSRFARENLDYILFLARINGKLKNLSFNKFNTLAALLPNPPKMVTGDDRGRKEYKI